jgi:hypothetical protein
MRCLQTSPSQSWLVPDNDLIVIESRLVALMTAWNKAEKETREEFLDRVKALVIDRRFGC